MKSGILIVISTVASSVAGVVLAGVAFCFAWGLGDYSVGNIPGFTGGWLLLVITLALAFLTTLFSCRPFGRFWWVSGCLLILPTILFLGGAIIRNLQMGHVPVALLLPLLLIAASGFTGGFVGSKRESRRSGGSPS